MEPGQTVTVEDRIDNLERECSFWRNKFDELDKWRETLEQWIFQNFGFHIRTNTRTGGPSGGAKLQVTSPSNGWSPDSDVSSRVSGSHNMFDEKIKRRGRRKKQDIDYKETDDPDEFANNVPVQKRKRGRPKKSQVMGMLACPPGPTINSIINSFSPDIKQESSELSWDAVGESAGSTAVSGIPSIPMKRGRGRPKKIKSENDEYAFDDGEREKRKPGRKKRELGMPISKTCDVCVLEFENNYDLLAHKRVVHADKFHKCTICSDTYLHAGFLARHMETHTLDKEYKCHLCISSFNTYQLLKTHCLEKHGVDLGRQADWKRDNELAMTLKNHDFGHTDYSPQSMMSSPSQNCSTSGTPHALQSQLQHHLQQQQQQQQSQQQQHQQCGSQGSIHQGSQQIPGSVMGNSSLQTQLQMSMGNPNVNQLSSQISNAALQSQLQQQQQQQQQQSQLQEQHHHHHHHQQQQPQIQEQQHHHHQQSRHQLPSLPSTDDDDLDMDDDPLNSLFNDTAGNEGALGNYLNNMEPDPMQLY